MQSPSANALLSAGRFADALRRISAIETRGSLGIAEQVLQAELFSLTGDADSALAAADRLIKHAGLTANQRCRLRHVLGLSNFRKGDINKGTEHYTAGVKIAEQHGELADECRLRVSLFRNQLGCLGPFQAAADLAHLRRKVLNLADPSIAVAFQFALTELAAKLGLMLRARKHLETAAALAARIEDEAIQADLKMTEVALAALEGNLGEALQSALQLVPLLEESGYAAKFTVPINLGHLLTVQARFDEALRVLTQGLNARTFTGGGQVAMLDTLMQLHVFQGNLEQAASTGQLIQQLLDRTQTNGSSYDLWHQLTRVKYLYRVERTAQGVELALDTIPRIQRMADRNLLERMTLLAAEGMGAMGNIPKAANLVAVASLGNPNPSLDVLAEIARVTGALISTESGKIASSYFDRARKIFVHTGNLAAASELENDLSKIPDLEFPTDTDHPQHEHSPFVEFSSNVDSAGFVNEHRVVAQIATLMEIGSHGCLLATETLSLISATDSVESAQLLATSSSGQKDVIAEYHDSDQTMLRQNDAIRILFGTDRGRDYEILAVPRSTASARLLLLSIERLVLNSLQVARARQLERENAALWPEQPEQQLGLICSSQRMLDLVKTIRRVAGSNITVLLTGETGVGKELFARALHQASQRSEKSFLPFNCTTVPRDMFDSQLFGHRRGSFTGAHEDSIGIIRSAAGGTLFLDEIGEMSIDVQPKLLRFLESGEVQPLGDPKPKKVDVRVVAATNANLDQLVADGRFREDLYYRLNVIRINIPPLRERREEIPALVEHFLEKFGQELQKPMLRIADETLEYLVLYRWPGNVRQLANEIRRLVAMAEPGGVLMPAHLSDDIAMSRRTVPVNTSPRLFNEVIARIDQPLSAVVEHVERAAIQRALSMTDGRLDEAAKMLGLSRKGLYLKRQRLNLG
jgi:DNA-binding NtrC family response regulator